MLNPTLSERLAHAICHAAIVGDASKMKIALETARDRALCGRALSLAAEGGHLECSRLLLARSATEWFDRAGLTPLMLAAKKGHAKVARLLLESANPNARGAKDGRGALHWAAVNGRVECVDLLLTRCDPSAVCDQGETALMLAAWAGHLGCARSLLPVSNLFAQNAKGKTAMDLARDAGRPECAAALEALAIESMAAPAKRSSRQGLANAL